MIYKRGYQQTGGKFTTVHAEHRVPSNELVDIKSPQRCEGITIISRRRVFPVHACIGDICRDCCVGLGTVLRVVLQDTRVRAVQRRVPRDEVCEGNTVLRGGVLTSPASCVGCKISEHWALNVLDTVHAGAIRVGSNSAARHVGLCGKRRHVCERLGPELSVEPVSLNATDFDKTFSFSRCSCGSSDSGGIGIYPIASRIGHAQDVADILVYVLAAST